jgi:hypothetical protein
LLDFGQLKLLWVFVLDDIFLNGLVLYIFALAISIMLFSDLLLFLYLLYLGVQPASAV